MNADGSTGIPDPLRRWAPGPPGRDDQTWSQHLSAGSYYGVKELRVRQTHVKENAHPHPDQVAGANQENTNPHPDQVAGAIQNTNPHPDQVAGAIQNTNLTLTR